MFLRSGLDSSFSYMDEGVSGRAGEIAYTEEVLPNSPMVEILGNFNEEKKLISAKITPKTLIAVETPEVIILSPHPASFLRRAITAHTKEWELETQDSLCVYHWGQVPAVLLTYSSSEDFIEKLIDSNY